MAEEEKKQTADSAVESTDITLSTGVVLRAKKANPLVLIKVMAQEQAPQPPTVYMEKMGREVINYEDPTYLDNVEKYNARYSSRLLDAMLGLGTEIVSVPKDVPKLEDESWVKRLKVYGIDTSMQDEPDWRKINWLTSVACQDEHDLSILQKEIQKLSGVSEEDVAAATNFSGRNKK